MNKSKIITIPNILSLFRILLIPLIILFSNKEQYTAAGIVVLISGITDGVDGFIARHFNQISDLGKVLDPVADKLTQWVVTYCIARMHPVVMLLFVILICKEVFMGLAGLYILHKGGKVFGSEWWGKVATFMLFVCMAVIWLFPGLPRWSITGMTLLCTFLMVFSLIKYLPVYRAALDDIPKRNLR